MKIKLLLIGKTEEEYLRKGISVYEERLKHYIGFEMITIDALKNTKSLSFELQKEKEATLVEKYLTNADCIILLDENGKQFSSVEFAVFLQKQMNNAVKNLIFIVGGPYGFSENLQKKANFKISLSRMTFSHQLVRLIFAEQLYRAFTIIKNEPYHHE